MLKTCRQGNIPCSSLFKKIVLKSISTAKPSLQNDRINHYALGTLENVHSICTTVSAADYSRKLPSFYNGSVGAHVRHILNHYEAIVRGLEGVKEPIQYDKRIRSSDLETDPLAALSLCNSCISAIQNRQVDSGHIIKVEFICDKSGDVFQVESTLDRELAFVSHHGIHHLSTVRIMMESIGYSFPDKLLGVAPSTANFLSSDGH